jgi:hypothetical protein
VSIEFQYTDDFYKRLNNEAERETINGIKVDVFKGSLTELYRAMGIGQSYYSRIMDSLKSMGCVTMVQRGSRKTPSILVLHHAPDRGEWQAHHARPDLTKRMEGATLSDRVFNVEQRLGGINIVDAFKNLEERLQALEKKQKAEGE